MTETRTVVFFDTSDRTHFTMAHATARNRSISYAALGLLAEIVSRKDLPGDLVLESLERSERLEPVSELLDELIIAGYVHAGDDELTWILIEATGDTVVEGD